MHKEYNFFAVKAHLICQKYPLRNFLSDLAYKTHSIAKPLISVMNTCTCNLYYSEPLGRPNMQCQSLQASILPTQVSCLSLSTFHTRDKKSLLLIYEEIKMQVSFISFGAKYFPA